MKKQKTIKTEDAATIKVRILLPVAGKFLLSHNVGDEIEMETKQANELIEAAYAEKV